MKCPNCKKEVPDDALGCGYCGTKFSQQTVPAQAAPNLREKRPARIKTVKGPKQKKQGLSAAPPRWLLPAALAAFAVLAALGLFLLLRTTPAEEIAQAPASKPAVSEKEEEAPLDSPNQASINDIAGAWSGEADGDDGTYEIFFQIENGCEINDVCGTFNVPVSNCSGELIFTQVPDANNKSYKYRETNESDGCVAGVEDLRLRLIENGDLEYYASGDYGTDQGIILFC